MLSIIYGLFKISIYSLSQPPPAKAVHGHGTLCIGANMPNCHPVTLSPPLFLFTLLISKLRPPTVINALPFSLHSDFTYAMSPRTFTCYSRTETCTLLTRSYAPFSHSFSQCCICHVTASPITLAHACVYSFFFHNCSRHPHGHVTDRTRSCLHALIFTIVPAIRVPPPVCATHNTRQCQPTRNDELCHSLRCLHCSLELHHLDSRAWHITFTLIQNHSHNHSFHRLNASLIPKQCPVRANERATSQFAQPPHVCQTSLLCNLSLVVEGFYGHGMGFCDDVGVTIFTFFF
jgi:hypothetical protein